MNSFSSRKQAKLCWKVSSVALMSVFFGISASDAWLHLPPGGSSPRTVLTQVPVPSVVPSSQALGATNPAAVIHLSIGLPSSNLTAFQAYADAVSTPGNALYGHFLTPAQVGAQFGASATNVQAVVTFLQSNGFTVNLTSPNGMAVIATGTVAQAEKAFQTTIGNFHSLTTSPFGRTNYYSFETPISVPSTLAPAILSVSGLQNFDIPRALHHFKKQSGAPLTVNQARVLYNTAPMFNAGLTGKGRVMAISNWDGFQLSNVPLEYTTWGLPTPTGGVGSNITVETIQGGSENNPPGGEGDLDIQMELGMAPLAHLIVYDGGGDLLSVLTQEASDNMADIISESWEWTLSNADYVAAHQQHLAMTVQGITYMSAAGDTGTTYRDIYPHIDPEVLSVGGTVPNFTNAGVRVGEVAWSDGGGGWNTIAVTPNNFNSLPSWQKGTTVPTNENFRLIPDIAAAAAGNGTGALQFYYGGSIQDGFDGTSFASPLFAGCLTVMEHKLASENAMQTYNGVQRLGRIQNKIYSQNGRSDVYFDVTAGSNGLLPDGTTSNAKAGWDYTTGWGAVNFLALAETFLPPIQVSANSVAIYGGQGAKTNGTLASLLSIDNSFYTEQSVLQQPVGNVAALTFQFTPQQVSNIKTISFQATGYSSSASSYFVYVVNPASGQPVLMGTVPLGTSSSTVTVPITNYASYLDSAGHITVIARAVAPTRSGVASLILDLDQVDLYETF